MQVSSTSTIQPSKRLVAHLLEVLAQRGDVVEGDGGLAVGVVVADEERLCGLVGDDAFLALGAVSGGCDAGRGAPWGGSVPFWP